MKINRHLEKIVQGTNHDYNELVAVKKALLQGQLFMRVDAVARSGLSRTISINYGKSKTPLPSFIYKLAGCTPARRISGGGMDMLFAAQYNLFTTLCPNHKYQDSMPNYQIMQ